MNLATQLDRSKLMNLNSQLDLKCVLGGILDFRVLYPYRTAPLFYPP